MTERKRPDGSIRFEFVPEGRRTKDRIRLAVSDAGSAAVSFIDASGLQPDPENGEIVSINQFDPKIATRLVSALAVMHLSVRDAETNYTAADIKMIENHFSVGTFQKTHPAWVKGDGKLFSVILNGDGTGLPAIPNEPVQARLMGQNDSSVLYHANCLEDGLRVIDNGYLRFSYVNKKNIVLLANPPDGVPLN
jgi:hypothetical protein